MPLGTLDRTPPPFFRQGPSALTKLALCSALAVFLMVADTRFTLTQPLRALLATALHPIQRTLPAVCSMPLLLNRPHGVNSRLRPFTWPVRINFKPRTSGCAPCLN